MKGWTGKILFYNLSKAKFKVWEYGGDFAGKYVGGRGFAVRILWERAAGIDPLSPANPLIFAAGPLTGLPGPSTGKLVVASKSPLTGGYGDGNLGSLAALHLRWSGFDALVVEGKARKPSYLYIENGKAELLDAEDLWGLDTFAAERKLKERHGKNPGILVVGPAAERGVLYSTIISQEGRAGGRPGIGTVMALKNLKAVVFKGTKQPEIYDKQRYNKLVAEAYRDIEAKPNYEFWIRQGTMAAIQWSQANSVLPTYNFSEGIFDHADKISGDVMEKIKVERRGCPLCNMQCGNVIHDSDSMPAELDYENVALLGSNLGIGDLREVAVLNRIADMLGLDTISLGNTIGFAIEAGERGLLKDVPEWGDSKAVRELVEDIAYGRTELGKMLAQGVKRAAKAVGNGAEKIAMHVKGLEVSGYDCHASPAMALAYGTSPIGAHHKDAWIISWEVQTERLGYTREKVEKLIWMQRIRGGVFETLVSCRLPWVELGFDLDWYLKLFSAATGFSVTMGYLYEVADRVYALIRSYWVREYGGWSREMDRPPAKWFEQPLTKGPYKGAKLSWDGYEKMLSWYYNIRGWDERGVPRISTLRKLGLDDVAKELGKHVPLSE